MIDTKADKVEELKEKCQKHLQKTIAIQAIWIDAAAHDIEIPWDAASGGNYVNVAVFEEDEETGNPELNEDKTKVEFAKIIKWARSKGYEVEKKYDDDTFNLWIDPKDDLVWKLNFYSTRQVVCTKRVVGTKVVPAKVQEIVEWDCEKIAFSAMDI